MTVWERGGGGLDQVIAVKMERGGQSLDLFWR